MAVGAALIGCRPVVEILFIDFAMLVMDQIVNQAAKYHFISGGQGRVPMVLRTQGGAAMDWPPSTRRVSRRFSIMSRP